MRSWQVVTELKLKVEYNASTKFVGLIQCLSFWGYIWCIRFSIKNEYNHDWWISKQELINSKWHGGEIKPMEVIINSSIICTKIVL